MDYFAGGLSSDDETRDGPLNWLGARRLPAL